MKYIKYTILSIWLMAVVFVGSFSANRLTKNIDDRKFVTKAAERSLLRYKISAFREILIERELKMAKFGLFRLWDGMIVAEEDEFIQTRLHELLESCKSNRMFFDSLDESVNKIRKKMFVRGCWMYYKKNGIIFDESRYQDVKWENQLERFAKYGVVEGDYIRMQKW